MEYRQLGRTGLEVSAICLGTMTWGSQNTEDEAHAQLDYALDHGVNFIDTAEMYPVPPQVQWMFRTECYIGSWLAARGNRGKVILATKIAGRTDRFPFLRGGPRLNAGQIDEALTASLRRLRTDHVDLYQLHWPDRQSNFFGNLGYAHDADDTDWTPVEDTLEALSKHADAGRIRHIGLSNETPWGVMEFLRVAEARGWPRIVSIQNPYSLLNRSFEIGLAEMAIREDVGLLAYSPLGFGTLSGKYLAGAKPEGARLTTYGANFPRYLNDQAVTATERYVALARAHGLDPAQMALAYVNSRPFVTANIIGASKPEQLADNIASIDVELSEDVLKGIEEIHRDQPNPAP